MLNENRRVLCQANIIDQAISGIVEQTIILNTRSGVPAEINAIDYPTGFTAEI